VLKVMSLMSGQHLGQVSCMLGQTVCLHLVQALKILSLMVEQLQVLKVMCLMVHLHLLRVLWMLV
jgi:hypothetical protein